MPLRYLSLLPALAATTIGCANSDYGSYSGYYGDDGYYHYYYTDYTDGYYYTRYHHYGGPYARRNNYDSNTRYGEPGRPIYAAPYSPHTVGRSHGNVSHGGTSGSHGSYGGAGHGGSYGGISSGGAHGR